MKFKTVREGEQAIIWNYLGEGKLLVGPQRVFLFRDRLEQLDRYAASQYEYLKITDNGGLITHVPGPTEMFLNPLEVQYIVTHKATKIDANHMVIVYKKTATNNVERRVVQGPTVFIPDADEWLHEFEWHGEDIKERGHMIAKQDVFTQLDVIPSQFYYNVREVRTNDDTLLTVKLMIFYELKDVINMLENTHDPVADLINAVCSDVISFAGKLSFPKFLENMSNLNILESYPQLLGRANRIGYNIAKVVYKGYHSSEKLQTMQDSAIQGRTQLRLNTELQEQTQHLLGYKINKEQHREQLKQQIERSKVAHKQAMDKSNQEHDMWIQSETLKYKLEQDQLGNQTEIECQQAQNAQQVAYLNKMADLKVDLTQYLMSQHPPPIHEEIRVTRMNMCHSTHI